MAKQSSKKEKAPKKNMTKLIVPVKLASGAYAFKEEIILAEKLNEALAKKRTQ
ncbi:MAG: DUF4295 family protein [Bacteroidota bacterium]